MADAGIHQHQGAEAARMQIGGLGRHHAAEAMADDQHVVAESGRVANGDDLGCIGLGVVAVAVIRVAHAGEVHGGDAVLVGELWGDEVPPVAMRVHAVDQQHRRGLRWAVPQSIGHIAFVHLTRCSVACVSTACQNQSGTPLP